MKRIIVLSFALISSCLVFAQSAHLLFNNKPVDGQLTDFVQAVKAEGINYVGTQDSKATLKGNFYGFNNSVAEVYATQQGLVYSVILNLESKSSWEDLQKDYNQMKSLLTGQSGQPADVVEHFIAEGGDAAAKMTDVTNGAYAWHCTFITKEGNVTLSIAAENNAKGFVTVNFVDKANVAAMRKK